MKEWETGMAELRAHRTRESFRRKFGRSLGASRKSLHPYGRSSSRRTRRGGKRQSLHRLSRSTQEEWASGVSQWVARREVERVNRRFRNALGLNRDYSTEEWRELHQEWQDRALLAKASKWLRHSKTEKTRSFAKRRMVASVEESVERSATLRGLRTSDRQADRKKHAPKAKPKRKRQATADHVATTQALGGEVESTVANSSEATAEKIRLHAPKNEWQGEEFVDAWDEGSENTEHLGDMFDDDPDDLPTEERRRRTLIGFLFRVVAPAFFGFVLVLYLCDFLNQRMGWKLPIGLDLVGIETGQQTNDGGNSEASRMQGIAGDTAENEGGVGKEHTNLKEPATGSIEGQSEGIGDNVEIKKDPIPDTPPFGNLWTVPTNSLKMIWCKPGTFTMGSPQNEKNRGLNETQHQVTLTRGFYLGKYEVTQAQWDKVMGKNHSKFKGAKLPVEQLTWKEAFEFCSALTKLEQTAGGIPKSWKFTLPTEAQWEYACRAGTKTTYAFGNTLGKNKANTNQSARKTRIVGSYPANAWGFHDMHGNVREWCIDWYGKYPTEPTKDPQGPRTGTSRVNRGGSWVNSDRYVRSSHRSKQEKYTAYGNKGIFGFRVAFRELASDR